MIKRLTLDDLQRLIVRADYHRFPDTTVTVCCLRLQNGFNVIGTSACIDPEQFSESIGRTGAQQDAIRQMWQLEGYLAMHKNFTGSDPVFGVSAILNPVEILTPDQPPAPPELPAPRAPTGEIASPDAYFETPSGVRVPLSPPSRPGLSGSAAAGQAGIVSPS